MGRAECSLLEHHLPYVPLAAALRDAGIELDGERLPALARILPELALIRSAREFSEIEALEALVQVISAQAPVVLLLDDLHAADQETIAALDYVQQRLAGLEARSSSRSVPSTHPPTTRSAACVRARRCGSVRSPPKSSSRCAFPVSTRRRAGIHAS